MHRALQFSTLVWTMAYCRHQELPAEFCNTPDIFHKLEEKTGRLLDVLVLTSINNCTGDFTNS